MIENWLVFLADNGPGNVLGVFLLVFFATTFVGRVIVIYRKEHRDE